MIGFMAGLGVALVVALALELYNSRRITKLTSPMYEYAVKKAENESAKIIEEAQKKARDLMAEAERASLAVTAERTKQSEGAEHAYEAALKTMLDTSQSQLAASAKTLRENQDHLSETMLTSMKKEEEEAKAKIVADIGAMTAEHKKRLDAAFEETLKAAKADAESYGEARKAAIEAHIFALVKEAVRITLQKSLPPEAHGELVRAALEEAKQIGTF